MKDGKNVIVSVSIPEDLLKVITARSNETGIPRSRIVTHAIGLYLSLGYPNKLCEMEVDHNA